MKDSESSKLHYFDFEHAKKYGVKEAIVLQNIIFWVSINLSKAKNFRYGRYWMYCSVRQFKTDFHPYFSTSQIRTILKSLEKQNVIIKRNLNVRNYSNPDWFTVRDQSLLMDLGLPIDKLDEMSRFELKELKDKYNLDIHITDLSNEKVKYEIRKCLPHEDELAKKLKLDFPDAENDWFIIGEDNDEIFEELEEDGFDKLNIIQLKEIIIINKLISQITRDMGPDDIRNILRRDLAIKNNKANNKEMTIDEYVRSSQVVYLNSVKRKL